MKEGCGKLFDSKRHRVVRFKHGSGPVACIDTSTWNLSGKHISIDQPVDLLPIWRLVCPGIRRLCIKTMNGNDVDTRVCFRCDLIRRVNEVEFNGARSVDGLRSRCRSHRHRSDRNRPTHTELKSVFIGWAEKSERFCSEMANSKILN